MGYAAARGKHSGPHDSRSSGCGGGGGSRMSSSVVAGIDRHLWCELVGDSDSDSGGRCGCASPRTGAVVRWGGGLVGIDLSGSGADVEDERPTTVGSPLPVVNVTVPLPAPSGVDMELVFLEVGVLLAMVTPVVEPEGESAMTPARYTVTPIPELSVMVTDTLEAASPAGSAVGSPAMEECPYWPRFRLLGLWCRQFRLISCRFCDPRLMTVRHLDWRPWTNICLGVLRRPWGSLRIPICFRLLSLFVG